jgi:hypothetical protein
MAGRGSQSRGHVGMWPWVSRFSHWWNKRMDGEVRGEQTGRTSLVDLGVMPVDETNLGVEATEQLQTRAICNPLVCTSLIRPSLAEGYPQVLMCFKPAQYENTRNHYQPVWQTGLDRNQPKKTLRYTSARRGLQTLGPPRVLALTPCLNHRSSLCFLALAW